MTPFNNTHLLLRLSSVKQSSTSIEFELNCVGKRNLNNFTPRKQLSNFYLQAAELDSFSCRL